GGGLAAGGSGDAVPEVLAVWGRRGRGLGPQRRPLRAAVGRDLNIGVVVVRLDAIPRPERELGIGRRPKVDGLRQRGVHTVATIPPPERAAGVRIGRDETV